MFLLDTNVISEARKPRPHGAVLSWLGAQREGSLLLSAITVLELQRGAERTRRHNPPKAQEIDQWIGQVSIAFPVIALDIAIAREGAKLIAGKSEDMFEDAMLAATARLHRLTVATRNLRDFKHFDVPTYNPFTYSH